MEKVSNAPRHTVGSIDRSSLVHRCMQPSGATKHGNDAVRRADHILDDDIERRLGRLNLDERSDSHCQVPASYCSPSLPLALPGNGIGKASLESPPGLLDFTLRNFGEKGKHSGRIDSLDALHGTHPALNDVPYAWRFTPDWSQDMHSEITGARPRASIHGDGGAAYHASPTFDSVPSSDTESCGSSSYETAFSLSPIPNQPGEYPALPDPNTLARLRFDDIAERNHAKPHPEHSQTRTSFGSAPVTDRTSSLSKPDAELLAATSPHPLLIHQQSLLIHQLQELQSWRGSHVNTSMGYSQTGNVFAAAKKSAQPRQWRNLSIPEGPSPKNRKVELYKTEMCRNWEELGACEYGGRCQFAHGEQELRLVQRDPRWKTKPCRSFAQYGSCPYAKRCCFRHDQGSNHVKTASSTQSRGTLLQRVGLMPGHNASAQHARGRTGVNRAPYF